jgi:two-component system, cell cycle sensor histidine kinase and response regulator CckA
MKTLTYTLTPTTDRYRILVVDDNPSIHSDFRKILSPNRASNVRAQDLEAILFEETARPANSLRFELDSAYQGQEALELVKDSLSENRPYSLAFVDVRMPPGWDGIETIGRLWGVYPRLQVVICTAYSDYSWEEMRARLGHSDSLVLLKKPFDNVEVQQLAHALTRKWELNLQAELKVEELEKRVVKRTAELEKANQALGRSEERFAKAFHTSPVAMAIESLPGRRFVDVNERMTQLTGCSREEMIHANASELFIWKTPQLADLWFEKLSRNEPVREEETEVRHQAGDLHQVLVSLSPVALGGEPHALLVIQDMTERYLLERQLRQAQKMEAIGQLAAGVAHDFNNILTVIHGHAGLLKNQIQTGRPPAESADKIAKAADRAAGLIRQLLMFSRRQVMQFHHLDLNETLHNAVGMMNRLVGEHIRLEFLPSASLPAIHADSTMIDQVIMNLAVNARDAMPDGGQVTITTELATVNRGGIPMDPEERNGEFVRLTFSDTGCGMNTAVLNRIFEPFFTTKAIGKGTGLGLSTVFGIVRQHSGWIEVASKPGQGSVFRVYFPASPQAVDRSQSTNDTTNLLRGRETVLVVEDEEPLREMVSLVLTTQGYKVLTASSGVEALKIYEQANRRIDLLLTDMVMPGGIMGGDLAERLRAINRDLRVIFTSGYSPGMAGKDISLLDSRNFLPKPYPIGKLAHFVREILERPVDNHERAESGVAGSDLVPASN